METEFRAPLARGRGAEGGVGRGEGRVLTTLENLEISGNLLILENSGKTQGISNILWKFCHKADVTI